MIDPLVRPAQAHEAAQVRALEADAREAVTDQRGGARWLVEHPEVGAGWPELIETGDVLVAHIDDVVVGYMVTPIGDDAIVRVDQVWVMPETRELGFGDALLELAIERGRAAGATAVEGQALPGDRHTKNLYERAGIVARLITTYRKL